MKYYNQLTQEQRYHIYALYKAGNSKSSIAKDIGVHKSTISREIKRNCGSKGYRPKQAHALTQKRRQQAKKHIKFTSELERIVTEKILLDWSPDQISGYFKRNAIISLKRDSK